MQKKFRILIFVSLIFLITGCSTKTQENKQQINTTSSVLKNKQHRESTSNQPAPVADKKVLHLVRPATTFKSEQLTEAINTVPAGDYQPINRVTIDNLERYELEDKTWISPAAEFTKNWVKYPGEYYLPILMYHDFQANMPRDIFELPINTFSNHLKWLKEEGYQTLTPEEAYYVLTTHRKPAQKVVWLTADDGYKSWYAQVFPLLKKEKMKMTGFQVIKYIDSPWNLNMEQLKEMNDSQLFTSQSHSMTHQHFAKISPNKLNYELNDSNKSINSLFNNNSIAIAYPFGNKNSYVVDFASKSPYWMALDAGEGLANTKSNLFALPRIDVTTRDSATKASFLRMITTGIQQ